MYRILNYIWWESFKSVMGSFDSDTVMCFLAVRCCYGIVGNDFVIGLYTVIGIGLTIGIDLATGIGLTMGIGFGKTPLNFSSSLGIGLTIRNGFGIGLTMGIGFDIGL